MLCQRLLLLLLVKSVVTARFEGRTELINILRKAPREYSIETESCCDGVIVDNSSEEYDCCGHSFIEKHTKRCCAGKFYDVNSEIGCCHNVTYDTTEYACRLVQRQVTAYSIGYDYTDDIFHFTPVPLPEFEHYCGNMVLNRNNQICCNFVITDNPDGDLMACCGTQGYNSYTHVCCKSGVTDYNTMYNAEYNTLIALSDPGDDFCCNFSSYNSLTHYCSHGNNILELPKDGKVVCNGYLMDPETQLCCDKPVLKTGPDDQMCCGDRTFQWGEGACCNDHVFGREKYMFYEGKMIHCCGDKGPYDDHTQTCCRAYEGPGGYEIFEDRIQCCGGKGYDPKTHDCCGITVVPKPEEGKSSCCIYPVKLSDLTTEELNAIGAK